MNYYLVYSIWLKRNLQNDYIDFGYISFKSFKISNYILSAKILRILHETYKNH